MKTSVIITLLLAALVGATLTGCESDLNTVYFGSGTYGIYHVPAKGGTPKELVSQLAMVMGLAYSRKTQLLYAAQQSAITRWGADGSNRGVVIKTGNANCVAINDKAGRLYWGDQGRNQVASCDLQGEDLRVLVSGVNYPNAVAVNQKLGLLYWVQDAPDRGVWMARLDGSEKHRISAEDALVAALAVDIESGRIFWARQTLFDWPGRIVTANSDGSEAKVVVSDQSASIEGLAVDNSSNRIVWIERRRDGHSARIRSATFEGKAEVTICDFTGDQFARSVTVGPPRK